MKNSPTLCQKFVAQALIRVRRKCPKAYVIHYMDDILLAHPVKEMIEEALKETIKQLTMFGLIIAPKKVQRNKPLSYLG